MNVFYTIYFIVKLLVLNITNKTTLKKIKYIFIYEAG